MSKQLSQLTVFVSGTSETDAEKEALRVVVDELNRMLERTHNVTVRVVSWPLDVRPGVNVHPQAEITRQIGDYDIYVGMLGTEFGTPTKKAGSGTEEEFEDALQSIKRDSTRMRVLFYFKRAIADPYRLNFQQFQKVMDFRAALTSRGVLYRDFVDTTDFVALVRDHLHSLIVDEWRDGRWVGIDARQTTPETVESPVATVSVHNPAIAVSVITQVQTDTAPPLDSEEEEGLLDHVVSFNESVEQLNHTLEKMTANMRRIGEHAQAKSAEIDRLREEHDRAKQVGGNRVAQQHVGTFRALIDEVAKDLQGYADETAVDLEGYRRARREMFEHFRGIVVERAELNGKPDSSDAERAAVASMAEALRGSRASIGEFQAAIRRTPALTGKYKKARQHASTVLGALAAEWSMSLDEVEDLSKILQQSQEASSQQA